MKTTTTTNPTPKTTESSSQPTGFFARIFGKLDASLKQKADKKQASSCCGDKGGKCC